VRGVGTLAVCAALGLLASSCGSSTPATSHGAGHASAPAGSAGPTSAATLSITPAGGGTDTAPNRGVTVTAAGGKITAVHIHTGGERVTGSFNASRTVWQSRWALNVSQAYTVTATAVDPKGVPVTQTSTFRTLAPRSTFTTEITEAEGQTYGVGMPIILYFSRPVVNKKAVERALQVRTSKPVVGAWWWDSQCSLAPECLYFRPRRYWKAHTRVSFTGHLNGVEAAPGVYGHHTLTQTFVIGRPLIVVASTANHYMNVYRDGSLFAHWPISTGRPGDETPDGTYLTSDKANPVDMKGPGYNIEVPWSVRITWSGDYLHDAYWSVGEQGFTNVSHGCVNMPPADAETYYKMEVPGDPVKIIGSPRPGTWDNGWTMWFLSWHQWVGGSALHKAVRAGPHGSTFISLSALRHEEHVAQEQHRSQEQQRTQEHHRGSPARHHGVRYPARRSRGH
jgi:lipoprotein-anchoring transpeptidase ErfK/SrfK